MVLNMSVLSIVQTNRTKLSEKQISPLKEIISYLGGELSSISFSKCDKMNIQEKLIFLCDNVEDNIILVIDDTKVLTTLSNVAYWAIKEVIDNDIFNDLKALISKLIERLKLSFNRSICGVRKQKLIINMCSVYTNAMISLNGNLIREIVFLMNMQVGKICNIEYDNNSDEAFCNYSNTYKFVESFSLYPESDEEINNDTLLASGIYKKLKQSVAVLVTVATDIMRVVINEFYEDATETVKVNDVYGRILANDIFYINVPFYNISTKHGCAVLTSDEKGVRRVLKVRPMFAEVLVTPSTCVRIRSGEPIPKGATSVVTLGNTKIIENVKDNDIDYFNIDDMDYEIEVIIAPKKNNNIRDAGCEIDCDEHILERFTRLGPAELGILTLCGIDSIEVVKLPSIGLLSIGNELEEPGNIFTLGRIVDSNRITLISLLKENDYDPIDFGISAYRLSEMIKKIKTALDKVDLLVIMGRANDKDLLKPILKDCFQAYIYFGCVDMKPGKSTTFAVNTYNGKRKFFLCMSANPATVSIVAHVLLVPLLNELRYNCFAESIIVQTRMKDHKLHVRPKFSWTTLHWTETEMYPTAYCPKNQLQNVKYQKANALLMFPPRTWHVSELDAAFVPAAFLGWK